MMKKVNFDDYANNYDQTLQEQHKLFGDISYYSEYKVRLLTKFFDGNKMMNILEYGCGIGRNLEYFRKYFPNSFLYATDISKESLSVARKRYAYVNFFELEDICKFYNFFDLIFIAGVYHHILPEDRIQVTSNIYNLCRPNGYVVVFEHNPFNPITRKMVRECEFDTDAVLLSKTELIELFEKNRFFVVKSGYTLFVPPRLKRISFIENYLSWLPLGG